MTSRIRIVITLYWTLLAIAIGTGSMTAIAWTWVHTQSVAPQYQHLIIGAFALTGFLVAGAGVSWILWTAPSTDSVATRREARY